MGWGRGLPEQSFFTAGQPQYFGLEALVVG
jgi:hypothetical protein